MRSTEADRARRGSRCPRSGFGVGTLWVRASCIHLKETCPRLMHDLGPHASQQGCSSRSDVRTRQQVKREPEF
jgi:hypothetical protein